MRNSTCANGIENRCLCSPFILLAVREAVNGRGRGEGRLRGGFGRDVGMMGGIAAFTLSLSKGE